MRTTITPTKRNKAMADNDLLDLVRYALSDHLRYHDRQMTKEDAEDSIRELLVHLLNRQPTEEEMDETFG